MSEDNLKKYLELGEVVTLDVLEEVAKLWTKELVDATELILEKIKTNEDYKIFFMCKLEEIGKQKGSGR